MATKDAINNSLATQTGTGKYVGSDSPKFTTEIETPQIVSPTATDLVVAPANGRVLDINITGGGGYDATITGSGDYQVNLGSGKFILDGTTGIDGFIDDDTFATASATKGATSESIKAYVDASSSSGISTLTNVNQGTHGLAVADIIKVTGAGTYGQAQADSATNAEVVGIVTAVTDANNFTFISGGQTLEMTGLTANSIYFLDPVTPGLLTLTEPTTAGQISRPVLYTDTTTSGFYLPYRGVEVGVTPDSPPTNNAKNLIIGGDFSLNPWQRGTSFAAIGSGEFAADRFKFSFTNAGAVTITKDADAPTVAEAEILTNHSFKVDVTTADATVAAGDVAYILNTIEGYDFAAIAQRAFTLSFWVKATKTGIHCVSFVGGGESYVSEYTIGVTDTWEKKTINIAASPAAGSWNYTNGSGLGLYFPLTAGTNFHTTKDAWQTGTFLGTSSIVNDMDSTANNFQIALVQVEVGNTATPFEIRSREQELALCQRYFQKSFNQGVAPTTGMGLVGAVGYRTPLAGVVSLTLPVYFPVSMRTTPGITYYNPTNANANWYDNNAAADSGAGTAGTVGQSSMVLVNTQVAGDLAQYAIYIHYTLSAEL